MDPFRLCLAVGPVAVYFLLLGAINLSRRPLLVSGVRDAASLALAVSGLIIIGPMALFFPYAAEARFGPHIWLMLLALYALIVVLWLLLLRPRLVIYNISADKLRPILAEVVNRLDAEARWAGDGLLPTGTGTDNARQDCCVSWAIAIPSRLPVHGRKWFFRSYAGRRR